MKTSETILVLSLLVGSLSSFASDLPRVRGNGGQAHGCVTGDTLITLSGGKEIAISTLKAGDLVVNRNHNEIQVFYTLEGAENKQMYRLETDSGKKISATEGHPFYSIQGLVRAKSLKVGSDVLTVDGFEKIVKVSAFDFDGMVYNLAVSNTADSTEENLESKDPFLGLNAYEHSVVLNGFITGDVIIQRLLAM